MSIEVVMLDSIAITLSLLSSHFQELVHFLVPTMNLNPLLLSEEQKPANFEHVIFGLQTVSNNVRAKRNHLDSFEFIPYLPADVVNTEL
jgi:DNA-directed RNA polymerase specialized sigma54-like protein